MMRRFLPVLLLLCVAWLSGCAEKSATAVATDRSLKQRVAAEEEVQEFYASEPQFFRFAAPADLPSDLKWTDDSDVPEIGSPEAKKGGTFYYYLNDFPRTLRMIGPDAKGAFRRYMLDWNATYLVEPHPNAPGKYMALIAKEWAVGADGRTVYYRIDPDARFNDGMPIRADDFFYMFYFFRSKFHYDLWYNDHAKNEFQNITKYDDLTISITVPEKKPDVVYRTSIYPVPLHHYQTLDPDYLKEYNWKPEPTPGAYEILPENMDKGRSITMTRVPDWWAAKKRNYRYRYNPDKLSLQVIRDPTKAMEAFKRGDIDFFPIKAPVDWHKQLPDSDPLVRDGYIAKGKFYNQVPRPTWGLRINSAMPLLKQKEIRQGIQFSLNWELVLKEVFFGDPTRMQTVADGYPLIGEAGVVARPFAPKEAEACFARAGFTRRGGDGILVNDKGERLSFTITTGYKKVQDVLTVLRDPAKEAGLELNIEVLEQTAAWKKAEEKKHQIVLTALNVSVEMYARFRETFHSENAFEKDAAGNIDFSKVKTDTNNETSTADPKIDALIEDYRKADSIEEIVRIARELLVLLHEDAAFVPGWKEPYIRHAAWRWIRMPDDGNVMQARDVDENYLFWIDPEMKKETLEAKKEGRTFPASILTWDQYKDK